MTADRVARGAGSAYRIVAGTESLDEAIKNFNSDVDNNTINIDTKDDFNEARAPRSGNFSLVIFFKSLIIVSEMLGMSINRFR